MTTGRAARSISSWSGDRRRNVSRAPPARGLRGSGLGYFVLPCRLEIIYDRLYLCIFRIRNYLMSVFIFQSVPDRFDLREEFEPGLDDTWYATRYRNEMRPGAVVFFWMGGPPEIRGVYG